MSICETEQESFFNWWWKNQAVMEQCGNEGDRYLFQIMDYTTARFI